MGDYEFQMCDECSSSPCEELCPSCEHNCVAIRHWRELAVSASSDTNQCPHCEESLESCFCDKEEDDD